ncbi:SET domain-containing protein [Paraburkholderia sp. MM6662-R1]|uniref:SET domain-containing protein n=1 Tax=Paraburkholderia sp. MM6662-R1 TaxID=2991066 RepID=UPI003D2234D6
MHGKRVFALRTLKAGERVLEYRGEVISWRRAARAAPARRHRGTHVLFRAGGRPGDRRQPRGQQRALADHCCSANCEAVEEAGRVFNHAIRDITAGGELFIDYRLETDEPLDGDLCRYYACLCGGAAAPCSGPGSERYPGRAGSCRRWQSPGAQLVRSGAQTAGPCRLRCRNCPQWVDSQQGRCLAVLQGLRCNQSRIGWVSSQRSCRLL